MSHSFAPFSATAATPDFDEPELELRNPDGETGLSARAAEPSFPRLRPARSGDDEEMEIPEMLLRRPELEPIEAVSGGDPLLPHHRNFRTLLIGATSAGALLVVMAGGLLVFANDPAVKTDHVVSVKTVPIEGQTSVEKTDQAKPVAAAKPVTPALDKADFKLRFSAAGEVNGNTVDLQEKVQDRLNKAPGPDLQRAPQAQDQPITTAGAGYREAALDPLLGYYPAASSAAGQRAIASVTQSKQAPLETQAPEADKPVTQASATLSGPTFPDGPLETVTVTLDVNLRGTAEKDGAIIGVVPKGTPVEAGNCDRWWCAVRYDGKTGFVGKKFVEAKG